MKNVGILIAAACLWLFFPCMLEAQAYNFRLLDTSCGLYNNQVRFITQMDDGKILVCTEGMFNVYDGNAFEPLACDLTHSIPLGMHNVCAGYDDGNGLLWAKDYYRLYLFDMRTGRFCTDIKERFAAAKLDVPINDFILDHDRQAWLISEDGALYRYDWQHPARMVYRPSDRELEAGIRVKDVMQASPFHLIFLNTGMMLIYEGKTGRIVGQDSTVATNLPSEYFRTAWLQADDQHLLISVSHREGYLYLYNIFSREWKKLLKGYAINDIKKNKDGTYWVGGNDCLLQLSPDYEVLQETRSFSVVRRGTMADFVISLLVDQRGGLWLGLGSSGVLRSIPHDKHLAYYDTGTAHRTGGIIRSLAPYDSRHVVAGTFEGIFLFDTEKKQFRLFDEAFSHAYCTDIKQDREGAFWFSTRNGLFKSSDGAFERVDRRLLPDVSSEVVRFCLPLSDGSVLVCINLKDLYLCYPDGRAPIRLNERFDEINRSRAMSFALEIKPGQLLIGGQNGLLGYEIARNKLEKLRWMQPFEKYSTKYNCAYAEQDAVWIGTQNGLVYHNFRTKLGFRLTTDHGLPNNCIQGIAADSRGNLWVSTSNGIGKITLAENGTYSISRLDKDDGVQYGEMQESAIVAMPDGHVYVGGMNGLTDIVPSATEYARSERSPMLVGLKVMNQPINNEGMLNGRTLLPDGMSNTRTLRLNHDENFIEMRFSALEYDIPQHTRYRYRLEGVDKEWNHTDDPTGICTASYTSLTPGSYTLCVQTALGDAPFGPEAQWNIVVKPPFWRTWWAYTAYLVAVLATLYYIFSLYWAGKRSRMMAEQETLKRQEEQRLDELKYRFFTNISHEFRTPLALIITPLELLVRKTADSGLKDDLERILSNARDLLRLVNQLLDFRRLEQQGERLKLTSVQLKPFIEHVVEHFAELARGKHIELACECQFTQEDCFTLDEEKITRVVNNLLSNALKFTPEGGCITVQAAWDTTKSSRGPEAGIRVSVRDTGVGISEEDLDNIFVRFFQSENRKTTTLNTGSGIGLHLVKGYVDLHHGEITVESKPGKGSCFTFTLPPQETAQEPAPKPEVVTAAAGKAGQEPAAQPANQETTILVVEDNEQFRTFMKNLLRHEFHVLTAADGREGLAMARTCNPDLIISDVMMPHMDGYEFCRHIKTDMECSHIPFILLTAKNTAESRSGAYEAGADSFISKPFDIDVLSSRIRQLLKQREKRQASFRDDTKVDPKEITITSLDETLMAKALDCIRKNMDNADYSVEMLSSDLGLERSTLYRKMQAITGQTPSEFIRAIRLKRAAELLATGQHSVQEISWMVGFNTPRYFSSYFKEMFGVNPSQYAAQKQQKPQSGKTAL